MGVNEPEVEGNSDEETTEWRAGDPLIGHRTGELTMAASDMFTKWYYRHASGDGRLNKQQAAALFFETVRNTSRAAPAALPLCCPGGLLTHPLLL